ncbi:MAG: CPBP family intramembrane metalloprotease [Legionellales bacterium]|nr:CPBP family intramembrane metalloprotease [Legionellales bacterium]
MNITLSSMILSILVVLYYHYFKNALRIPVSAVSHYFHFTRNYPLEVAKGGVGFILVVLSHGVFAIFLCILLKVPFSSLGILNFDLSQTIKGLLLGLGLGGTAAILTLLVMKLVEIVVKSNINELMKNISSGWIKSYYYVKLLLPKPIAYLFIIAQLACEEVIFRGVFQQYLMEFGIVLSILIATLLFALMQIFQMPSARTAMFPVIGALVMGPIHGILFYCTQSLWPLITSHTAFFLLLTA